MQYPNKKISVNRIRKILIFSLFLSQILVLGYLERFIPLNFGIPGIKLGLANIIILTALYIFNFSEVLLLVIMKTILTSIFAGTGISFFYSLTGGLLSFFAMYILLSCLSKYITYIGVSITGAAFHNIGQLFTAALLLQNISIMYYLPYLLISAVLTGILTGFGVKYLLKALTYVPRIK